MIKVLICDDSQVIVELLTAILESTNDFQVVGKAFNGKEAVAMAKQLKPDIITMDIRMPVMNGFEATRLIMAEQPTPIVVVSASVNTSDLQITFKALEAGALSVIEKPQLSSNNAYQSINRELLDTLHAMAEIKVIHHHLHLKSLINSPHYGPAELGTLQVEHYELIAIGCSTGGPIALIQLLKKLPVNFQLPILITQHISPGFLDGLIEWLNSYTALSVLKAVDDEKIEPGYIYFAPDHYHLTVIKKNKHLYCQLIDAPPVKGIRPSVNYLFNSIAACCGQHAIAILLTGMGDDGAIGMEAIHQANGYTIIQDRPSAIVYGMPEAALSRKAVSAVVKLSEMTEFIIRLLYQDSK
ncbi:chemotaxis-specific protein-glutamate methyltransferase CheB [Spartinivicinus poritis]|uniref:Protein-glutamate methylesterase/protein-glutamine glutaminase n=1 Tax=Spartinivicinus poritis TaxID=2994640 RepID=A0ABT5UED3_9GAMM|nr:chemotaxis-specific protein-glutamate methyltransferase CheB [Spartinivicinus sp. A2-2]MDE1464672.1 chemotaxis-specific protein-glutamate methyltransferase CheB [Spartinivicinus sp. A2-2]